MNSVMDYPRLVFAVSLVVLWLSTQIGARVKMRRNVEQEVRQELGIILAATLTLLGLHHWIHLFDGPEPATISE